MAQEALELDGAWRETGEPAPRIDARDVAGQQRVLSAVADCVDAPGVPLRARRVLRNLRDGSFEKLGFAAGTSRSLLEKPADVGAAIRAGSVFLLPAHMCVAFVIGRYRDKSGDEPDAIVVTSAMAVLAGFVLLHLLTIPLGATAGPSISRLAVVDARGEPATAPRLLARWAVARLPLLVPLCAMVASPQRIDGGALVAALALIGLWPGAAGAVVADLCRGLHGRLTGTWLVRR